MEKSKSPPHSPREIIIKIKLLDIFPSILELKQQQNDLEIIFQGLDVFYNLYDLLKKKTEVTLNLKNKTSIIISLIKSNNIFATCIFNIKQGEQWVTFSYENKKKKETSFAQSLIDCIKIKLNCEISKNKIKNSNNGNGNGNSFLNTKKISFNNNIKNIYLKQNTNYSSLTTDENLKLPNKMNLTNSNKALKNISIEGQPKGKAKYSYIKYEFSNKNKSNKEINILNRGKTNNNCDKIINDDSALRLNKIVDINNIKEESKLNLTQKPKKKNGSNNNLNLLKNSNKNLNNYNKDIKLYNNFDFDISKRSKQIIKNKILNKNSYNFELNIGKKPKNKNKIEKSQDNNIESLYISNSHIGTFTNRNNSGSKKEIKSLGKVINQNNSKTPVVTKSNKCQNAKNLLKEDKNNQNQQSQYNNNEQSSSDYENENANVYNKNDTINNLTNSNDYTKENNGFEKLKEDFILLYNDNYIKNVQEDLLKLEIELFVEKMTGLISTYNFDINELKLKNKLLEKKLKIDANKFFKIKKLYYKLKLFRKKYKKDNIHLNKNRMNVKLINDKEFEINKKEIYLFNYLYPFKNNNSDEKEDISNANKKEELKKILNIILSKSKNKNILPEEVLLQKFKLDNMIKLDNNKEEKNIYKYTKPKPRTRIIPKLQQTKFNVKNMINNINEINIDFNQNSNLNDDDIKIIFNFGEMNSNSQNFYNKKKFMTETYNPKKTYLKKIAK